MPKKREGKERAKPGSKGEGKYYRIELRSKEEFVTFRYHDVGDPGHILRLAAKKKDGTWEDQAWLIQKDMAHENNGKLVGDHQEAKELLKEIGPVNHLKGDVFKAITKK